MNKVFQNWADVRVFLAVMRSGSALGAGKALDMPQPTVARRLGALEQSLGLSLFERDTRGSRPTDAAKRLLPLAEQMEQAAGAIAREAEAVSRADDRPIRLTAPVANFSDNLTTALADFMAEHPGARFEFVSNNGMVDLMAGEADVAIRIAPRIEDERLICRKMTEMTISLYASKAYAERRGFPKSGDDLAGHDILAYNIGPRARAFTAWVMERIDPAQISSRYSEPSAMLAATRAGFGLGMLPTTMAEDDGTLVRCFPPPAGTETPCWLVISPDAYARPVVKAFATFFPPRFKSYIRAGHSPDKEARFAAPPAR